MIAASFLFACMGVCVKFAAEFFSTAEIVFYRSLIALLMMVFLVRARAIPVATPHWRFQLWRSISGFVSLMLYFYALSMLPLATAVTLAYTSPLFLTLYLCWFKHERLRPAMAGALTLGFVGVVLLLFMMGAGLVIGTQLGQHLIPEHSTGTLAPLPSWMVWPAIAVLGVSMLGVLQAPLASVHVMVGGSLLAWAVFSLVDAVFGNVVGAFAGALAVASAGHLYAYSTGQPDILVKIPGLLALVPGSMGFRGVHALIEQDSSVGVALMTNMALTGAVLAVGLLLADNIAPLLFARRQHPTEEA